MPYKSPLHNLPGFNLTTAHIGPPSYSIHIGPPRDTYKDKLIMNRSNREVAYVSSAVGGSLSQISFGDSETRNRSGSIHGRGIKDKIKGFSRVSRRNLLRKFASINRTAFRAFEGRVISVTLTYPNEYPEDPQLCKNHLKALRKRLQRRFGDFSGFWRMGIQRRGAWHFHLLLFVGPSIGPVGDLRRFISSSWHEVTGKVSEGHLRTGTRVEAVKRWKEATSYVERYMAKPEDFPEGLQTGRIWGVWNGEHLP